MRRFLFTILAVCIGCGSIPSVVFVPDDAGGATDDGGGGGADGGTDGALGDGGGSDAPLTTSCQGINYPASVTCCQNFACVGACKPPACKNDCEPLGCAGSGKACCLGASGAHCVTPDVEPCN